MGINLKVVEEFVYLVNLVACRNEVFREVKWWCIAVANRNFYELRNQQIMVPDR